MVRDRLELLWGVRDDRVSALASDGTTSQDRYRNWANWVRDPTSRFARERLVPWVEREIVRSEPGWSRPRAVEADRLPALAAEVETAGPWFHPFELAEGIATVTGMRAGVAEQHIAFRRELINGTVEAILGDELSQSTVLDIGCNCGVFSLDIAARGARHVTGIDLRSENIAQAELLRRHYGVPNLDHRHIDIDDLGQDTYDVVLNLGVLYHVTNPLQHLRQTWELCRRFAVIDTMCLLEPVSAFMLLGDKDVAGASEGRESVELHPTYRGVIDGLRYAGFSEVFELVGRADPPHDKYAKGSRRCFLAVK